MKSILLEGTIEQAPCETCKGFTAATYAYGPVELEPGFIVEDVMRATCNHCGNVVATAPQSSHRFRKEIDDRKNRRTTFRISQELRDFISLNLSAVGADPTHDELYFRALLVACKNREEEIGKRLISLEDQVLACPNRVTANLSLSPHLEKILTKLQAACEVKSTSELMRRLLVLADGELESATVEELKCLAYAYA